MLALSKNCFLVADTAGNQGPTFTKTDAKLYVSVVTLSTQDNVKKLKQIESGFKKQLTGIDIKLKNQSRHKTDILADPSFQGVNKLFDLSFEDKNV